MLNGWGIPQELAMEATILERIQKMWDACKIIKLTLQIYDENAIVIKEIMQQIPKG